MATTPSAADKPPSASATMPPMIHLVRDDPASDMKPQFGRVIWMP